MNLDRTRFCLNRIVCPGLNLEDFFKLSNRIGLSAVELRNDLPGETILDDLSPSQVRALSGKYNIQILTINAIQRFNLDTVQDQVHADVREMVKTALAIGCGAIVLCPNNDISDSRSPEQCYKDTVAALERLAPVLQAAGIVGMVEPFGFNECSLQSKKIAVEAIRASGYDGYRIVHDTFHHYLGPDETVYPMDTGIAHISGVQARIPRNQIRDEHRILITAEDVMRSKDQINALENQGYQGFYSFEPFSPEIQNMTLDTMAEALSESFDFIQE